MYDACKPFKKKKQKGTLQLRIQGCAIEGF